MPRERARENEDQADRFALEVLRRVGQPIDGLLFWFLSAAHFRALTAPISAPTRSTRPTCGATRIR